ncbi:MAG: dihydropteroate synthase [Gammaproteobacteria bacterium]|nr:dihydropteroate synthase [Gammaproteobacteria bacterium]MBT8149930.1 dihydropteroate synthase [Gammaproteobacteria bacterium]NND38454.1 dihydropteroate synthase [Pseudomonadales bacterium]NNM11069.1 dihydropteroate synthase [Pseudomonadales bacterium]RZV50102.1 MAG: dihydropteroate synthase [Pseudomonadales bacterium]
MGVVNVTPDSFSDGGRFVSEQGQLNSDAAMLEAQRMLEAGASIIDIGGESTRPGAASVSEQQEIDRVMPVLERIVAGLDCVVSVDTSSPVLMRAAASAGAGLLNDVRSFQREGAARAAADSQLPICIMHMQGEPGSMQDDPEYGDVVGEVSWFLRRRIEQLGKSGVARNNIVIDPGFGFGKLLLHNLTLLAHLDQLHCLGCPMLVGMSRKSMLGQVLDKPVGERLFGGVAAASIAALKGAKIVRTHDVAATVDAVKFAHAVRGASDS